MLDAFPQTLTNELAKLIEQNKEKFSIDKQVLDKKVSYKLSTYSLVIPPINAESIYHSRVRKYYKTLQALIIDSTDKLHRDGYTLDSTNTKTSGSGFAVTYIKSESHQAKDKTSIKKETKEIYLTELEAEKLSWVEATTLDLAKESEAQAIIDSQNSINKLQDELLDLLNKKDK